MYCLQTVVKLILCYNKRKHKIDNKKTVNKLLSLVTELENETIIRKIYWGQILLSI